MGQTARRKLDYPELTDGPDGADVPYWIKKLADEIDGDAMIDGGNLSARPVSTVGTPGIRGRFYLSLDQSPVQVDVDLGTSWLTIYPISTAIADGSLTTAKYADSSVTSAKIADGTIATGDIAAKAITGALIADALKPSAGAANGSEALRAIGSSAGQVVAGNDARLAIISNGSTGTGAAVLAASPTLTGTPHVPTAAVDTATDQAASCAFVVGQASALADGTPAMDGTAARGSSTHYARANHVHPTDTTRASTTDARLSDERTPTDGSVTTAKLAATSVTTAKIAAAAVGPTQADLTQVWNYTAAGGLKAQGMRVHRHPYTTDRHTESGSASLNSAGPTTAAVTFTDPFAAAPVVVSSNSQGHDTGASSVTTTGFTFTSGGQTGAFTGYWIAEGRDT